MTEASDPTLRPEPLAEDVSEGQAARVGVRKRSQKLKTGVVAAVALAEAVDRLADLDRPEIAADTNDDAARRDRFGVFG